METKCLEALFKELNESKNISRQAELQRDIRVIQSKFVREMDNEGLIHLLRFLKPKEKNRVFIDLLRKRSDSSLFVLAFADSDMSSYKIAYEKAMREYDDDEDAMNQDIQLMFDEKLCNYLSKYRSKEDYEYVQLLTDGSTWLEANKRSSLWLFFWNWELTFSSFF